MEMGTVEEASFVAKGETNVEGTPQQWECAIDLHSWIGAYVHVETSEGITREGKLTGIDWHRFEVDGVADGFGIPTAIWLNNDPTDTIDLHRIRRMKLR